MRLSRDASDAIRLVSLWCSALVCLNHTYTLDVAYAALADQPYAFITCFTQDVVKYGVVRMSTPFFFIVAAFLLFTALLRREGDTVTLVPLATGYRGEIAKRVRSLAVPFLLWAAWSFVLLASLQQLPQLRGMYITPLLGEPAGVLLEKLLWNPVAHPLWFVRDLFLLALIWPLAWMLLCRRGMGLAVIAALCVPWFMWWEVRETRALVFFAIGAWLAIHRPSVRKPAGWLLIVSGTLWLVGAGLHAAHIMKTGQSHPVYNNLTIIAELVTVWYGAQRLLPWLRRPWLLRATSFTFFIYVAHEPIATFARKAAVQVLGDQPLMLFVAWLLAGCVTFLICLAAAMALQRWLPAVYGLLTGGRVRQPQPASQVVSRPGGSRCSSGTTTSPAAR